MKRFSRVAVAALVLAALASPALADVTISMAISGGPMEMKSVAYIRGLKMRTNASVMGRDVAMLMDIPAKQAVMWDPSTKELIDPGQLAAGAALSVEDVKVSLEPSGQTKAILGKTCDGYAMSVSFTLSVADQTLAMSMTGTAWIAKDAPGRAEYSAFYKAAADSGLLAQMPGMGPQSKAMTELQRKFADLGVPYEQQFRVGAQGSGQMADMVNSMAGGLMTMRVSAITTDAIADDLFIAPAKSVDSRVP